MIAPDPSLCLTETPACGMNSRKEWTVFRETRSFYGVAHDRLARVGATVSASFLLIEADRQIGVWCVPPITNRGWRNLNLKRTRSPEPIRSVSSRRLPLQPYFDSDRSVDPRALTRPRGLSQENRKIIGPIDICILDIRGHIGVYPEGAMPPVYLPPDLSSQLDY